ncbi:MAG TPA: hypothetical protein V6D14_31340 [Coleofasciculaceae cyanobacterium]|jgi:hypothetical protein
MLFHLFCEFADGSSKYLHLRTSTQQEAIQQAIQVHCASVVLFIICSLDPHCRLLGLEYIPPTFEFDDSQQKKSSQGHINLAISRKQFSTVSCQ